jgi:uncharacterized membrane protein YqgA involved in biofilm formation
MTGTLINTATVLVGSTVGTFLRSRFPDCVRQMVMWGMGLISLLIGSQMSLTTEHILIVLGSLLAGGVCGEVLRLHEHLNRLGDTLQTILSVAEDSAFREGFVTASPLFCVGPMTILASIQDGLSGDYTLLAFQGNPCWLCCVGARRFDGLGVLLAALTVLVYQGGLTLGAGLVKALLTEAMVAEMTATGGALILAIGLNLLDLTLIRVANFLPALVIAPALVALLPLSGT